MSRKLMLARGAAKRFN